MDDLRIKAAKKIDETDTSVDNSVFKAKTEIA
jgi:hypothetical protein